MLQVCREAWRRHQKKHIIANIYYVITQYCEYSRNILNIRDNITNIHNKYGAIWLVERVYLLTMAKPVYHFY